MIITVGFCRNIVIKFDPKANGVEVDSRIAVLNVEANKNVKIASIFHRIVASIMLVAFCVPVE